MLIISVDKDRLKIEKVLLIYFQQNFFVFNRTKQIPKDQNIERKITMKEKYLVIIRGKGTKNEKRIQTNIKLYYSEVHKKWMTIPEK